MLLDMNELHSNSVRHVKVFLYICFILITLSTSGRTMTVRDTVLDDFKTLVRQQGMSDDTIIIKQNKGTTLIITHTRTDL